MDTLHLPEAGRPRRRYSPEFKAQLLTACQQPGISMTGIALANQINPNVVRRWLRESRCTQGIPVAADGVVIKELSTSPASCPSGLVPVKVAWPAAHAEVCALWLRGLMP